MDTQHQATHDDVCEALQKEADDWKAEALRALHATYNAHVNGIKEVPPKWKAAAAFSFCTGAVEKLFPTSLGKTMDKVRRIYEGTIIAPGHNSLLLLRLEDAVCAPDRVRWHCFQRRIRVDDIDVDDEKGKYKQEFSRLQARFNNKVACVIPIETIAEGNIGSTTYGPRVAQILAHIDKFEVVQDSADWRFGTDTTWVWETEQPTFSIHTVAQTFDNKLPAEAMKAFKDAENQIWNHRRA